MNKQEALKAGYELLATMPEQWLEDLIKVKRHRIMMGNETLITKNDYHGEISYSLLVKEVE